MSAAIGFDMEIIVSVAYRLRGDEFSMGTEIQKWPVRTPVELDAAMGELRDRIWSGVLDLANGRHVGQLVERRRTHSESASPMEGK